MPTAHETIASAAPVVSSIMRTVGADGLAYAGRSSGAGTISDFWTIGSVRLGITTDFSSSKDSTIVTATYAFGVRGGQSAAVNFRTIVHSDRFEVTGGIGLGGEEGEGGKYIAAIAERLGFRPGAEPRPLGYSTFALPRIRGVAEYVLGLLPGISPCQSKR